MSVALYPGSFDPITHGHIDIAVRAASIFSKVIAVVSTNPVKKPLFSQEDRLAMAQCALKDIPRIEVISFTGLTADCLKERRATAIIRGLRALSDFDYEFQMAFANREMGDNAETIFLMPSEDYTYLNSTVVREVARLGGNVGQFVTPVVEERLRSKLQESH